MDTMAHRRLATLTRVKSGPGLAQDGPLRRHGVRHRRMMRSLGAGFAPEDAAGAEAALEKSIPLGRHGEPADIANLVLFLASDESRFITGAQYRIDGGMGAL